MPRGRPSDYSLSLVEEICFEVATSTRSIRTICEEEDRFPDERTVYKWLFKHEEFRQLYARAREYQIELIADELVDIVDDGKNDWMERENAKGEIVGWQVNGEAVQRSKLRADTRKWLLSKINPKKYGDSTTIKGDAENPLFANLAQDLDKRIAARKPGPTVDAVSREMLPVTALPAIVEAVKPAQEDED